MADYVVKVTYVLYSYLSREGDNIVQTVVNKVMEVRADGL